MRTQRLVVSGRVQGVGYRAWFAQLAERNGVWGWVRNRHDGTVEAVVQGDRVAVAAVIEEARIGPAHARVDGVDSCQAGDPVPPGFEIRPSA